MIRSRVALRLLAPVLLLAGAATAQIAGGPYQGPGVLSRGAQGVGNRGGQQVALRYSININGIYDTGLVPFAIDSDGKLLDVGGQAGVEGTATVYGSHAWRRSLLGVDYSGGYRRYASNSSYSGSNQMLRLGYTFQPSRRLSLDWQASAGTTKFGTGYGNFASIESFDPNTALLFDNRLQFGQGGLHVNYQKSARTQFSGGGQWFTTRRDNAQFASVNGYSLDGTVQHQISRTTIIGAAFTHLHYDYSRAFGETDINSYTGIWQRSLGRSWRVGVKGGIFVAEVQGLERTALDPAIAEILGVSAGVRAFYRKTTFPTGDASLTWQGRSSLFTTQYQRSFNPGNGVYLTSTVEGVNLQYSYNGVRKWSFSFNATGSQMKSVGQDLSPYKSVGGSIGATRTISESLYITARLDTRQQQISAATFHRWSNRYSVGISFSPGSIPLSLW